MSDGTNQDLHHVPVGGDGAGADERAGGLAVNHDDVRVEKSLRLFDQMLVDEQDREGSQVTNNLGAVGRRDVAGELAWRRRAAR